ncbi:cytochrome c oxidase assembly factor 7 [Amblyraja radiata]|uniref:cytochrome c oxidase assembly factor 7 n=1 Tax=Amblyraja radiata TaxID=386614 RepID=UPI0014020024|nr:cytochrome c oxidase assembly factor 7 [Amblyraja radiata]
MMSSLINFQNEAEVKEFLDNLGIEYSYQCRKEKDPEGCQRLADYLEGIKKNYEAAAEILKHNCEKNHHGESCYKLGTYYVTGKGGLQQNMKTAYECFVKSCEKGGKKSIDACHNAALLAHDGQVFDNKPNSIKARDYYTRSCNGNFVASCFNLSTLYMQGAPGVTKDMAQAMKYSLKACELGHIWACANTSRMYKLGEGVSKDDEKAELFKNRAKDLHREQNEFSQQLKFGQ